MDTERLVTMLATGDPAPPAHAAAKRFALALVIAAVAAVALTALLLGLRSDLADAAGQSMFWVKFGFGAMLAGVALPLNLRLGRPGARLGWLPGGLAAIVLALWAMAALALAQAAPPQRAALVLGQTWAACPWNIAGLSIPGFVALLFAMSGLAPTRPALAGAGAGLLSGAVAAAAYTLHCPELDAPFLAVWYVLGILIPTAAGALAGPRVLRW